MHRDAFALKIQRDFRETGPGYYWFEGWIGLFNPLTATLTQQLDRFWKYFSNGWCRINALNRTTHSTRSIKNQTIRYIETLSNPEALMRKAAGN